MKKLKFIVVLLAFILLVSIELIVFKENSLSQMQPQKSIYAETQAQVSSYDSTVKRDLLALWMAYPEHIESLQKGEDNRIYVIMQSGSKIIYDDMKTKTFEDKLANADIQDMMEQVYPLTAIQTIPENNFDPGRIRVYAFLKEVYGRRQGETENNLTNVFIGSKNLSFNKKNNAAAELKAAFHEVSGLVKKNRTLYNFVYPVNGTYNYRVIAGTNQLSPHAFGIAIDLKSDKRDYWRWATKKQGQSRLESYPSELVQAFENHYFIWGGKWSHFDFLHFEYRPELVIKSKYKLGSQEVIDPWYLGYPDNSITQAYINSIDCALK